MMQTLSDSLVLNPLCNVILGFRNYTKTATRSKYVSFPLQYEPEMCSLLLDIANAKLNTSLVNTGRPFLVEQLVTYGLLVPIQKNSLLVKIKNFLRNPLNENSFRTLEFNQQCYLVTSFIFMAFTSKAPNDYIKETIVLPHWVKKFSRLVYDLIVIGKLNIQHLPPKILRSLLKHGVLINKDNHPNLDAFFQSHCRLSKEFLHRLSFIPRGQSNDKPAIGINTQSAYLINKQIYFSTQEILPGTIINTFYRPEWINAIKPTIILTDPVTHVISAYWLSEKHASLLHQIIHQQMNPDALDEESLEIFTNIHALEKVAVLTERREQWHQSLLKARQMLKEKGYCIIHDLLHPVQLTMLRTYIRYIYNKKYLIPDKANGETKKRFWQHRENVTFYVQSQILGIINQILPSPVKIGHNAITVYEPGASLPKHQDDVLAFSWVMSLAIDTNPEITREHAWPMYVQINDTEHKALLGMGDGMLINPQMPHWRETLTDHTLGIMFFWFVNADYKGYVNGSWIE